MKNQNYYVLKTIYKLSKRKAAFIPLTDLLLRHCPENIINYLYFYDFLDCKRENQTDYYRITTKGIDYIDKQRRENINLFSSVIAAIVSIIGLIISIIGLYLT